MSIVILHVYISAVLSVIFSVLQFAPVLPANVYSQPQAKAECELKAKDETERGVEEEYAAFLKPQAKAKCEMKDKDVTERGVVEEFAAAEKPLAKAKGEMLKISAKEPPTAFGLHIHPFLFF